MIKSILLSALLLFPVIGYAQQKEDIKAFCIDFNWSGRGYASLSLPEDYAQADPVVHYQWYKEHGVNTIQSFCVSHNGYAWYDSKIAPKVPGLKSNFLKELVELGHKGGMRVMGYFSPAVNVHWLKTHPEEVYDNGGMFHIVYTKKYLQYLYDVIYEAVSETGIDGFMIDALFTAPLNSSEAMKWMECEQEIYEELFQEKFPGKENITPDRELEYKRRSVERCWNTIRSAAKKANRKCIIWLTCHQLTHEQFRPDSKIYKQVDWLMNENSDQQYIEEVRKLVGKKTKLIQCISGWADHDSKSLLNISGVGFYGFAWPNLTTTLPYTREEAGSNDRFKRNAENIAEMKQFYRRSE